MFKLPCISEGAIVEYCKTCNAKSLQAELRHIRDCDKHERVSRGHVSDLLMSCDRCPDYQPGPIDRFRFHLSADGIGDAIIGLFAAAGLADRFNLPVEFYTKHPGWFHGNVSHPGVTILPHTETEVDGNFNYDDQLATAAEKKCYSRGKWYCDSISRQYGLPPFDPVFPAVVNRPEPTPQLGSGGYVILSPFSAYSSREWPEYRWTELAHVLHSRRQRVIVIGSRDHENRLSRVFGSTYASWWYGQPEQWVCSAIANADGVICNDSGMAHVAGLYSVPCRTIMTHVPGNFVFGLYSTVKVINANRDKWKCQGCVWRSEYGFRPECNNGCPALRDISAIEVLS